MKNTADSIGKKKKCKFVPLGSIRHNKSIFPALCNKHSIYFCFYSIVLSSHTLEILLTRRRLHFNSNHHRKQKKSAHTCQFLVKFGK